MGVGTAVAAAASIGGSLIGASSQRRAARRAAAANAAQQRAALEFQKEMTGKAIAALDESEIDANMIGERLMRQGMAQAYQGAAARGMASSTVALGAQRAAAADAAYQAAQIRAQQGQARAAVYQQQDFPMMLQEGPSGNRGADYGALGLAIGKMAMGAFGGGGSSVDPATGLSQSTLNDPNYQMHQDAFGGGN